MIQITGLSFSYRKKDRLFDDLSLTLEPGTIYGLLGKNGAGKTTLLKLLCGFMFPGKGEIRVLGDDPAKRTARMLREIVLIPEEFFVPPCTAEQYMRLNAPFYPRFDAARFREYLAGFELDPAKKLTEYSYGQKKKFFVSFGLAANSAILLLDEPTNGLDIPSKSQFRRLVAGAVTEDRTFIISTHQVRDMENLIDPIVVLEQGKIVFQKGMEEISRCLSFRLSSSAPADGSAIYSEKVMGGYLNLVANDTGEETSVDIEVLFNALMTAPAAVNGQFKSEVSR